MKSKLILFREENARLIIKIIRLEFEKVELIEKVTKLKEKQLKNVIIKNLLHALHVNTFGQVSRKI